MAWLSGGRKRRSGEDWSDGGLIRVWQRRWNNRAVEARGGEFAMVSASIYSRGAALDDGEQRRWSTRRRQRDFSHGRGANAASLSRHGGKGDNNDFLGGGLNGEERGGDDGTRR